MGSEEAVVVTVHYTDSCNNHGLSKLNPYYAV